MLLSDTDEPKNSEPIKILLFPPKNKQFRFDEDTKTIEIEPVQQNKSTLTPLVEKCSISSEQLSTNANPINGEFNIRQICKISTPFDASRLEKNCFLKGCKWSGDGLCLLTNSDDNVLRLFEISNPRDNSQPVLNVKEGGTVYDYVWYPHMNSSDPVSCVFACTSQDSPIHLWDAYTGKLRATYQPINQYDEVTSAYSLSFSPDGLKLYSGFRKCLRVFDITQPGRIAVERNLKVKGSLVFQSNIVSSICINPSMPSLYVLGSYDKTIGVYAEPEGELICVLTGHSGGITQMMFSSDGNYLYSGGRKDDEILCWDMRNPGKIVLSMERRVETQQRIQFDLSKDDTYLITGTTDCYIKIFNLKQPTSDKNVLQPSDIWKAHEDCVNGVQFHPNLPILASASGQRHLPSPCADDDDDDDDFDDASREGVDNSIKLWSFSHRSVTT